MADARLFYVYAGARVKEGHKSMAANVRMRVADHQLSRDEVLGSREAVIVAAQGPPCAVLWRRISVDGNAALPQVLRKCATRVGTNTVGAPNIASRPATTASEAKRS